MKHFRFSLKTLLLLQLAAAANWLALWSSVRSTEVPAQILRTESGWKYVSEFHEFDIDILAYGWPLAYQWSPNPDENLSLPTYYRSYGIKTLPLAIDIAVATIGSLIVIGVVGYCTRRPASNDNGIDAAP